MNDDVKVVADRQPDRLKQKLPPLTVQMDVYQNSVVKRLHGTRIGRYDPRRHP